jgi:hypothetical protein
MQHYLAQLITDMRQAAENLPPKPYYEIPPEAEGIEYVIEWENATEKPMHEWIGIPKENFPPLEKLSDDELALMVNEIRNLWAAYNFHADLPENLPAKIAYKLLVDYFDKPVAWISEGTLHIEFCDYEPENCPFPEEFCMCKEFAQETDGHGSTISGDNRAEIAMLEKEIKEIENKSETEFLPQQEMVRYVEQLLEDMQAITDKMNSAERIPDITEIRSSQSIRELVQNPFVTLDELSGIKYEQLPEHIAMDGLQTRKVLRSMLQMLDAFNLKVYYPEQAPHEIKYEALRENWDTLYIKHLPYSGDDIDLCTGDPQTCPFGEFCECGRPLEFHMWDVPEKYREVVKKIAENNNCGYVCFYNPDTGEMEEAMPEWLEDPGELEDAADQKWDEMYTFENWEHLITIEPPESHESFRIMEDFAEYKVSGKFQQQLFDALSNRKPFRNFKNLIDESEYRQDWFAYKQMRLEERAWSFLCNEIVDEEADDSWPF